MLRLAFRFMGNINDYEINYQIIWHNEWFYVKDKCRYKNIIYQIFFVSIIISKNFVIKSDP